MTQDPWQRTELDIALQTEWLQLVMLSLPRRDTAAVPTMGTDGRYIYVNPKWIATLTVEELAAVRVHECLHVLLDHAGRMRGREPRRWNVAADFELNPYVVEAGYTLPAGGCLDDKYKGMSAEQIYELLPPSIKMPAYGDVMQGPSDPAAREAHARLVAQVRWGQLPEQLARALGDLVEPPLRMRDLVAAHLPKMLSELSSFARPSRRVPGMPGRITDPDGYLAMAVDTSGSISPDELRQAAAMAIAIGSFSRVRLLACDAAVHMDREIVDFASDWPTEMGGGGGTDFRPVFDRLHGDEPDILVFFTDACGDFPPAAPDYPVLWAVMGNVPTPWGERVEVAP